MGEARRQACVGRHTGKAGIDRLPERTGQSSTVQARRPVCRSKHNTFCYTNLLQKFLALFQGLILTGPGLGI